jgi:hypothetical protein
VIRPRHKTDLAARRADGLLFNFNSFARTN